MIVEVKPDHIKWGIRNDCSRCPVAQAIMDAIGDARAFVKVSFDEILVTRGQDTVKYKTPGLVRGFIGKFDARYKVKPFTFELDL